MRGAFLISNVGLGALALTTVLSCKEATRQIERIVPAAHPCEPSSAATADLLHVDARSQRTLHILFAERLRPDERPPWLAAWLRDPTARGQETRELIGAAEPLFRPICEGTALRPSDRLDRYQRAMESYFADYFLRRRSTFDASALVMIGGLAPATLDDSTAIGALNDLNPPTAPAGPERDAVTEFTQLLKAGYYFNRVAEMTGDGERFLAGKRRQHVPWAHRRLAQQLLADGKRILVEIKADRLEKGQRKYYDELKQAWPHLQQML